MLLVPPPRFDSGFTCEEIDELVDGLMGDGSMDLFGKGAARVVALSLGLLEGDTIELTGRGTVMMSEPREAIDARLTRVLQAMAHGTWLLDALDCEA